MPQEIVNDITEIRRMNILPDDMLNKVEKYKPDNTYLERLEINDKNIDSIYNFLLRNYTNHKSRLIIYSKNLLKFYFTFQKSILLSLKDQNHNIIGFISGVDKSLCCKNKTFKTNNKIFYVNFLCVSNNYRNSYIAPYLITQLWVFVNSIISIFHTVSKLPKAISFNQYYSRPININKLIKANVFELPPPNPSFCLDKVPYQKKSDLLDSFTNDLKKHYSCNTNNFDLIPCVEKDSGKICRLLNKFKQLNYNIFCTCKKKYIKEIIKNEDFISLKVNISKQTDKNEKRIYAYIDIYITKEMSGGHLYNNGHIHNFCYPQNWSLEQKYNFLESIVFYVKDKNVDILSIPSRFLNFNDSIIKGKYLKDFELKTHLFNYTMVKIQANKNGIESF